MLTLAKIAEHVDGNLIGDEDYQVSEVAPLDGATANAISFLSNVKFLEDVISTGAGCVLVNPSFFDNKDPSVKNLDSHQCQNYIICKDPYLAFAKVAQCFDTTPKPSNGISQTANVAKSAKIADSVSLGDSCSIGDNVVLGENVCIGANVAIGENVTIGENSLVYSLVSIYPNTTIGKDCILHANCVIGSDGFGFANEKGQWVKIPQTGRVEIGDRVEVGANTCIDRGALNATVIKDGVKIDNLCHIAHNVEVGENTAMAAYAGIAGSSVIGKNCALSGRTSIVGHLSIADNTHLTAGTMLTRSNSKAAIFSSGTGVLENKQWRKSVARFKQLDDMAKRIKKLEKLLQDSTNSN